MEKLIVKGYFQLQIEQPHTGWYEIDPHKLFDDATSVIRDSMGGKGFCFVWFGLFCFVLFCFVFCRITMTDDTPSLLDRMGDLFGCLFGWFLFVCLFVCLFVFFCEVLR